MEFAKGVTVPFPDRIMEEYQTENNCILANIDNENIDAIIMDFVEKANEPMYLGIHVPLSEEEEIEIRKDDSDPLHERVYYLDNIAKKDMRLIIDTFMDILVNDGLSRFVIASHVDGDEMFVQKYNLIAFFSEDIAKYEEILDKWGISKKEKILTAMETFTKENPGMCGMYENEDGLNIYDLIDALTQAGMYAGEIYEA